MVFISFHFHILFTGNKWIFFNCKNILSKKKYYLWFTHPFLPSVIFFSSFILVQPGFPQNHFGHEYGLFFTSHYCAVAGILSCLATFAIFIEFHFHSSSCSPFLIFFFSSFVPPLLLHPRLFRHKQKLTYDFVQTAHGMLSKNILDFGFLVLQSSSALCWIRLWKDFLQTTKCSDLFVCFHIISLFFSLLKTIIVLLCLFASLF